MSRHHRVIYTPIGGQIGTCTVAQAALYDLIAVDMLTTLLELPRFAALARRGVRVSVDSRSERVRVEAMCFSLLLYSRDVLQ